MCFVSNARAVMKRSCGAPPVSILWSEPTFNPPLSLTPLVADFDVGNWSTVFLNDTFFADIDATMVH